MTHQRQYHFPRLPSSYRPNQWDAIVFIAIFALFAILAHTASKMNTPYQVGEALSISLDPRTLPSDAIRTVIRMFLAMMLSLVFSIFVGTLAGKYRAAERILIPVLDILQSVPILGYLSITVVGFISLFPHSLLGPECAAIFAIFTSQAWNTALSVYQSFKTMPPDLIEASHVYRLSAWQRFWRVEMPYATPALLWNMMMSMSAGWFFVVAAEAISVSNQKIYLPGIGSYIATAINQADIAGVWYAILAMFIVILVYDQLLFRPLVKWSEKFKMDALSSEIEASSWVLSIFQRTYLLQKFFQWVDKGLNMLINLPGIPQKPARLHPAQSHDGYHIPYFIWNVFCVLLIISSMYILTSSILKHIAYQEILHVFWLGAVTALRVTSMVILASLIWVPLGVWIGMRPKIRQIVQPIAQFFAAFPANLLFPVIVIFIVKYHLNVNIWTTPLMIFGTQWYILFNVIAGAMSIPQDLYYAAQNFGVKNWLWWKRLILPGIFPYYITGALTAAGGCWNASIVSEVVTWGDTTLIATGLGAYITEYTARGDFPRIFLGITVMSIFVVTLNVLFWQKLYGYAKKRFQTT